jgi:hypothetical protein
MPNRWTYFVASVKWQNYLSLYMNYGADNTPKNRIPASVPLKDVGTHHFLGAENNISSFRTVKANWFKGYIYSLRVTTTYKSATDLGDWFGASGCGEVYCVDCPQRDSSQEVICLSNCEYDQYTITDDLGV